MSQLANELHLFINNMQCLEKAQSVVFDRLAQMNSTINDLSNNLMVALRHIEELQKTVISLQTKRLNNEEIGVLDPVVEAVPEEIKEDEEREYDLYEIPMTVRLYNVLKTEGYKSLLDIPFPFNEAEMLKTPNFGRKSLMELKIILVAYVGKEAFKNKPFIWCDTYKDFLEALYCCYPIISCAEDVKNLGKEILMFLKNYIECQDLNNEGINKFFMGNQYLTSYFTR